MHSQTENLMDDFKKIHQEKVFIHLNSNFLLTGETLLYKLSCLDKTTNQYSTLSKIVYVEILNDQKERVVQQKITLKNGTAQGDFFIRNSLTSGNYKVISYTKWMKNKNLFTATDLYIINPFQNKIQQSTKNTTLKTRNNQPSLTNSKNTDIVLTKKQYKKREKVSFNLNLNNKDIATNGVSVSVRKIDNQFYADKKTSSLFLQDHEPTGNTTTRSLNIPDIRGDVIRGQLISASDNKPIENIKVSLSIIQKNGFFLISNTDKNGYFHFIVDNYRKNEKSYIQLLDANIKDYKIILQKEVPLNFDSLSFHKLNTNAQLDSLIDKRSTYVQIENAYKNLHPDQIVFEKTTTILPNSIFQKYKLDEFTRFKSMKETMVEIIPNSGITTSNDNATFYVLNTSKFNLLPILLIDGFIVNNHNELASLDMSLVDEINISNHIFKFNSVIYNGAISVKTYKGEYEPKTKELLSFNLKKPLSAKSYFSPNYAVENSKITPDYRTQLYWEPNFNNPHKEVSFYTSDITGDFEIEIEGFTNSGRPISLRTIFTVQ